MPTYGTSVMTGLVTQVAEHLIQDTALTQADNAKFGIIGAASVSMENSSITATYPVHVVGEGFCEIDSAAHYVYKHVAAGIGTMYEYSVDTGVVTTVKGTWQNADELFVHQGDNSAILTDGGAPWTWNGEYVRKLGPLVGTDVSTKGDRPIVSDVGVTGSVKTITGISVTSGVIKVESVAHGFSNGDRVYIDLVNGMTEVNLRVYTVANKADDTFELDGVDGSDFTTYVDDDAGRIYTNGCGLDGDYQYRVSYTMTLPDGKVIESSPQLITFSNNGETVKTLAPTSRIKVTIAGFTVAEVAAWATDSALDGFTLGTDLLCGAKVYRTKADGSSFYVVKTLAHADIYNQGSGDQSFYDTIRDIEAGAAWVQNDVSGSADYDAFDAPPSCKYFASAGGYAYCMDVNNPTRLHISLFGDYDHWPATRYVEFPGVTALVPAGDYIVVFSGTRMWYYRWTGQADTPIGVVKEVPIQLGVTSPASVVSTSGPVAFSNDLGLGVLFFANRLGLWKADPSGATSLTDSIEDDWIEEGPGTWRGAIVGNTMYWCCQDSSYDMWKMTIINGSPEWSKETRTSGTRYTYPFSDPINNRLIGAVGDYVVIHDAAVTTNTMTLKSKWFGGQLSQLSPSAWVDLSAGSAATVTVYNNREGAVSSDTVYNDGDYRRKMKLDFGNNSTGDFWWVVIVSNGTIYGYSFSVENKQGIL